MNVPRFIPIACVIMASIATAGCSSTNNSTTDASSTDASSTSLSDAELEALFRARKASELTLFTEADTDFMTGMISHHAQALVMSAMVPTHGASSRIKTLASRIINAQNDEIATMQNWLKTRGQTVPEVHIDGTTLMMHGGGDHAMNMPGMLSEEQIQELDDARGSEFDQLFLTYMIQHHNGALTMVDELFKSDGAGQDELSYKLASDIHADQVTEIGRMELMLKEYAGTERTP